MNIEFKYRWVKYIPLLGVIPCVIDSSWDGDLLERGYLFYHAVWLTLLILLIT